MYRPTISFLIVILSLSFASAISAETCHIDSQTEYKISNIEIETLNIFDENVEDTLLIHEWANYLHIITKSTVIEERLPFSVEDKVSEKDIIEAEALLRSQRYLSNAEIISKLDCESQSVDLDIITRDNWSLIPTLSFTRSGGQNSSLFGVREDNLLGLGIRATARYN